ncbi:MAG: nuclease-related domain-containing protein [Acidimicrobiales bacterium]
MARARAAALRRQAPVATLLARLLGIRTAERDFRVGAAGEVVVARRLKRLDAAHWHVLHAVRVGENSADIDHVVIGPAGVFTVNTKHHPGGRVWVGTHAVLVNGQKTDYLRSSRAEAARASRLLGAACGFPVTVRPVIAVIAAWLDVRQEPPGVDLVAARDVDAWLRRQPATLGPEQAARIFEQSRRESTWRPGGGP